jgi:hypothetical protein
LRWSGGERELTLVVFSTFMRRGKSETPFPSVFTEDSRKESEDRSDATQSPYDAVLVLVRPVAVAIVGVIRRKRCSLRYGNFDDVDYGPGMSQSWAQVDYG